MCPEDEKNTQGFVIKDRRRFDSEGNEKSEVNSGAPASEKPAPAKPSTRKAPRAESSTGGASDADVPEINFSSFIMSLATQALMQLGELSPPPGMSIEVDKVAAKQTIDILSMLEEKTKNGLEADEARLLEEILHNLRISFLKTGA